MNVATVRKRGGHTPLTSGNKEVDYAVARNIGRLKMKRDWRWAAPEAKAIPTSSHPSFPNAFKAGSRFGLGPELAKSL